MIPGKVPYALTFFIALSLESPILGRRFLLNYLARYVIILDRKTIKNLERLSMFV